MVREGNERPKSPASTTRSGRRHECRRSDHIYGRKGLEKVDTIAGSKRQCLLKVWGCTPTIMCSVYCGGSGSTMQIAGHWPNKSRAFSRLLSRARGGRRPSIPSEDRSLSESIELSRKGERSNRPRAVARREVLRRGAKLLYVAPLVLVAMKATPAKANVSGQTPQLPPH